MAGTVYVQVVSAKFPAALLEIVAWFHPAGPVGATIPLPLTTCATSTLPAVTVTGPIVKVVAFAVAALFVVDTTATAPKPVAGTANASAASAPAMRITAANRSGRTKSGLPL